MLTFEGERNIESSDGLSRRDFLRVGSAGAVGLTLTDLCRAGSSGRTKNCIVLFLVGGPSQLETWDLKPQAPSDIRGPFRPMATNVPGLEICEHFPLMAQQAHHLALVRSVFHDAAPVHETGHQLMQTGHLFRSGMEFPHYGATLSQLQGARSVVLPTPLGNTGVSVQHGQGAGYLDASHAPAVLRGDPNAAKYVGQFEAAQRTLEAGLATVTSEQRLAREQMFTPHVRQALAIGKERDDLRARYGRNTFGQSCLLARRLVESGVRLVTVNMFETVFNEVTWDCHADGGALASNLMDYRDTLCPMFDRAYATLLEDLDSRGLLEDTMVVAMGEFGRTPQLNPRGGRDHWPGVWSVLFAGGGVRGGQVIGASDKHAAEPKDRPVTPAEIAASVYQSLGIDPRSTLVDSQHRPQQLLNAAPIHELFGG